MKISTARAYIAGDGPDTVVSMATMNALKGILDEQRVIILSLTVSALDVWQTVLRI